MRYEFHPEAEVDLIATVLYYESQAPGLANNEMSLRPAFLSTGNTRGNQPAPARIIGS